MYHLCERLFPICRSITGNGVRETLGILHEHCPAMTIHEVPTGTRVFDWTVPREWNIRDAWIKNEAGEKILDFVETNLHVVGYSAPVDKVVALDELLPLIYTQPDQPDAVPYVTSYYTERYGFCMTQEQKDSLREGKYHIHIDSELKEGSLTYGEIIIKGKTDDEIFLSTYVCHPSMANNELSGPSLAVALADDILAKKGAHRYTYRIIFIPETIGSLTYMSQGNHLEYMREHIKAGFNISCVGDDRTYTYIASKNGNTLSDRVARNVLHFHYPEYKHYSFLGVTKDNTTRRAWICPFARSAGAGTATIPSITRQRMT